MKNIVTITPFLNENASCVEFTGNMILAIRSLRAEGYTVTNISKMNSTMFKAVLNK